MSNFFTDGRLGLTAELQGDPQIDARVKTWFDYGPGLVRSHDLEPALCPLLSVAPSQGAQAYIANLEREVSQRLAVRVATCGQDAAPCEELAALVVGRVEACNADVLGLGPDGLAALRVREVSWSSEAARDGGRLIWTAAVEVELLWRRT